MLIAVVMCRLLTRLGQAGFSDSDEDGDDDDGNSVASADAGAEDDEEDDSVDEEDDEDAEANAEESESEAEPADELTHFERQRERVNGATLLLHVHCSPALAIAERCVLSNAAQQVQDVRQDAVQHEYQQV